MSRILLVSNSYHDRPTEYLASWFEKIVEVAKNKTDIKIIELKKEKSNKKELVEMIEKENPQFIVFNGHGDYDSISGFNYEVLIKCGDNEQVLSEKIVHALSCKCAKILGKKCITIGTHCFIGYEEDFHLWTSSKDSKEEQLNDKTASLFLDPAYEVIISLVEGKKTGEAFLRSQSMYRNKLIESITNNKGDTISASIFHNMQHQVCLGDKLASF
jgi:hypothetical protein